MKILVVGCNGQLGTDMMTSARQAGHETVGIDFPDIDITDFAATQKVIGKVCPDEIINCAAYTAVDACEDNRDLAFAVNALGPENLARCAAQLDATLVHISTDYVFDGRKMTPYVESDPTFPLTVYGASKLAGEQRLAQVTSKNRIFRIAWLYGIYGANFVKVIRQAAQKKADSGEPLRVVNDQLGSPTCTIDVCTQVLKLTGTAHSGIFHCTAEGFCSWFDFAREIVAAAGFATPVLPCTTAEFPRPAPRPAYSVLENAHLKALGLNCMRDWKQAFCDFLEAEKTHIG